VNPQHLDRHPLFTMDRRRYLSSTPRSSTNPYLSLIFPKTANVLRAFTAATDD
jgi:hypothetical protein